MQPRPKAMLTTTTSDSHCWNLVFMQMVLEELNFEVENLGVCVPLDLLVESCERHRPDLVVVSTVNGHGYIECVEIAERLAGLGFRDRMRLVAGGKLMLIDDEGRLPWCVGRLRDAGFDEVYTGPRALEEFSRSVEGWYAVTPPASQPLEAGQL